jgi:hypothetical protein
MEEGKSQHNDFHEGYNVERVNPRCVETVNQGTQDSSKGSADQLAPELSFRSCP